MGNGCSSNSFSGATNDAALPENRRTVTRFSTTDTPEIRREGVAPLSTQFAALSSTNPSSFCMKHNSVNDSAQSVLWEPRSAETTFAREDPGLASFEGNIDMSPLTIIPPALRNQHAVTHEEFAPTTATNSSNAASPKTLHSPRIKHGPPKALVVISAASAFHSVMPLFVDVTHHRHELLEPVVELHLLGEGGSRGERRSGASSPSCPTSPRTPFQRRRIEAARDGGGDPPDSSGNSLGQVIQSMDVSEEMLRASHDAFE